MKQITYCAAVLCIAFNTVLFAQETEDSEPTEASVNIIDADNPGMVWLDQATEAKLRASSVRDLSQVILLCQRAKRAGLSGENLRYCNQLLASCQLQRGLILAQQFLETRPNDWQTIRPRILLDLEEAVAVISDQPAAYLRIAQLNLLPDGDEDRTKAALKLAVESAKNDPQLQFQAVRLLADLEPEAEKREAVLATAAGNGDPQMMLLHALTLFEMQRNKEATDVLKKLIESESGNAGLHERIVALLIDFSEYESAIAILDTLKAKSTDDERLHRIDLMRAEILAKMEQYDDALKLLNTLTASAEGNQDLSVLTLLLRSSTYLAMNEWDKALKDAEEAEKERPDFLPVLEHKFRILIEQKNYDAALALVKQMQAIADRPQYALREILVLNEQGKHAEAVAVAEKLREQFPEDDSQWIMVLVEIHTKHEAYDKALAIVDEHIKKEPDDLRWIIAKTQIFTGQEKWDEAVRWLDSCVAREPESRELNLLLISVLADRKSYRSAKERMRPLLEKSPDDLGLLRVDSQLSISLGLHAEAVRVLTKVVEADPEDYTSVNNLAWILSTSPIDSVRNGRRAVELAERAAKLTGHRRAFVLSTLAAAYAESGDFDKAREISKRSVEVAKAERDMTDESRKEMLDHLQKEWDAFSKDLPFRELLSEEEK